MVRIQVQLTESELNALRRMSAATGQCIAELVRSSIDDFVAARFQARSAERLERAIRVAGMFSSGTSDTSANHDQYLAE